MAATTAPFVLGLDPRNDPTPNLAAALALAEATRRRVHCVTVVELPDNVWRGLAPEWVAAARAEVFERGTREAEAALDHAFEALGRPRPADLSIAISTGHPARALAQAAHELGSDTVVVGAHVKRHALDLGSVPRALLAQGPQKIWVQRGAWRRPERILCPVDLSELSLEALAAARDVALAFRARLEVLHSFVPPDFFPQPQRKDPITYPSYVVEDVRKRDAAEFDALGGRFDWRGVDHHLVFAEGNAAEAILSRQSGVDAIAIGTHGHTGLARFLLGNVAAAVLKGAEVPVLAIRPQ